jgi:hypothetical protein
LSALSESVNENINGRRFSKRAEGAISRQQRYPSVKATLSYQRITQTSLAPLSQYARAQFACSVPKSRLDLH